MTTYAWPDGRIFVPQSAELRVIDNTQRVNESPLTGAVQTVSLPGMRWGWSLTFAAHTVADRDQLEAFLLRLSGREHRVQIYDHKRQQPRGNIQTGGVTISTAAAQFSTSLQLAGCLPASGGPCTLLPGDWLGLPSGQLVRVVLGGTSIGGVIGVEVRPMLRSALVAGGPVTLYRPTASFVRTESALSMPRRPGRIEPAMGVDFVEAFP